MRVSNRIIPPSEYGGFYFICDHGKQRNAKRYNTLLGGETKVTPKIVPCSKKKTCCILPLHEQSRNPYMRNLLGWQESRLAQITLKYS